MAKPTYCLLEGRLIGVDEALAMRSKAARARLFCAECGEPVRPPEEGVALHEAHFQHEAANPGCSLGDR